MIYSYHIFEASFEVHHRSVSISIFRSQYCLRTKPYGEQVFLAGIQSTMEIDTGTPELLIQTGNFIPSLDISSFHSNAIRDDGGGSGTE